MRVLLVAKIILLSAVLCYAPRLLLSAPASYHWLVDVAAVVVASVLMMIGKPAARRDRDLTCNDIIGFGISVAMFHLIGLVDLALTLGITRAVSLLGPSTFLVAFVIVALAGGASTLIVNDMMG